MKNIKTVESIISVLRTHESIDLRKWQQIKTAVVKNRKKPRSSAD